MPAKPKPQPEFLDGMEPEENPKTKGKAKDAPKPKADPVVTISKGWQRDLDKAILERFDVVAKTALDVKLGDFVTTCEGELSAHTLLMIRTYSEAWMENLKRCVAALRKIEQ